MKGKLYICPSPIGNLEDCTLRVLRVLREVDFIGAEDTRQTRKLLSHYNIQTPMVSYHQHSGPGQTEKLIEALLSGKNIALISDAGTPTISDPGLVLVQACLSHEIEIDSLPGPCAAITALAASGFPLASFTYKGFLPRKKLEKEVMALAAQGDPIVLYESPRRIAALLTLLQRHMPDRDVVLAREISKLHQQYLRGKPFQLKEQVETENLARGEYTVVLGPYAVAPIQAENVEALVDKYLTADISTKDAAARLKEETGLPRREAYRLLHKKKDR